MANFVDSDKSARDTSVFLFPGITSKKCQRIFTKLAMCIDIVEIYRIANGQISSFSGRVICPLHVRIFVSGR